MGARESPLAGDMRRQDPLVKEPTKLEIIGYIPRHRVRGKDLGKVVAEQLLAIAVPRRSE